MALLASLTACGSHHGRPQVSDAQGSAVLQDLTSFEKSVLKDKVVTLAELLKTTEVYTECLRGAGVAWQSIDPADLGPSGLGTSISVPAGVPNQQAAASQMMAKSQTCLDEVRPVEDVWVLEHQASQSDLEKAKKNFVSCVQATGLIPTGVDTFDSAGAAARNFVQQNAGQELSPSSSLGSRYTSVSSCMTSLASSSTVAIPGLRAALANLDTSTW